MADPPQAPGNARVSRRRRIARLLLLLLLFSPILAWPWLEPALERRLETEVERRLESGLGGLASVAKIELFPTELRAEISGLRWAAPASEGAASIRVSEIELRASLGGLLASRRGAIRLRALRLEAPDVDLSREWLASRPASGESGRFDWSLGRLDVLDGRFRWDDRDVPLDGTVSPLRVAGSWSEEEGGLLARVESALRLELEGLRAPLEGPFEAEVVATPDRLELRGATWRSPAGRFRADLQLDTRSGVASGSWDATADLTELAPWLAFRPSVLEGRIEAGGALQRNAERWRLEGPVRGEGVKWGRLAFDGMKGRLTVEPGVVRVDELSGRGFGGALSGRADWHAAEGELSIEVDGRNVRLESLLRWFGRPLPLASRGRLRARLSGDPSDLARWSGDGDFELTGAADDAEGWSTDGRGRFEILDGRARVSGEEAALAGFRGAFDLEVPLAGPGATTLSLDGATEDASRTQRAVLEILRSLDIEGGDLARRPLFGRGATAATLQTGLDGTEMALRLNLEDGAYDGEPFREADLDLALERDGAVRIDRLRFAGVRQRFEAAFDFDPGGRWRRVDAQATWATLDWVAPWLGLEALEARGGLKGSLTLSRETRTAEGGFRLERPVLAGLGFHGMEVLPEADESAIGFRLARVEGEGFSGSGRLDVPWDESAPTLRVEGLEFDLAALTAEEAGPVDWTGEGTFDGRLELDPEGARGTLAWTVRGLRWRDNPLGDGDGEATLDGLHATWSFKEASGLWSLAGNHALEAPHDGAWNLEWTDFRVPVFELDSGRAVLSTSGRFHAAGPGNDPAAGLGEGRLDQVELRAGGQLLRARRPAELRLEDGVMSLGGLEVEDPRAVFGADARLSLTDGTLGLETAGFFDLSLPAALFPDLRAAGRLHFDLRADGPADGLHWQGPLRLEDGRAKWLGFPHRLDQWQAEATLDGFRVTGFSWTGSLGGGDARGGGTIDWEDGFRYAISARGERARVAWPEGFRGLVDLELRLSGEGTDGVLGGDVRILRGQYEEEFRWTDWLGLGAREYAGEDLSGLPEGIRLDLTVRGDEDVWFQNEAARIETRVDMRIEGDLRRPEYSGRIALFEGGQLRFRDVDYRILSGSLDFLGTETLEPYVNLLAETTVDRYVVRLSIDGTLDRFDYVLTSTPTLTQPDIIALLTTGRTLEDLSDVGGESSLFRGDLVANYFAGALTDRFERQIRRITGIERVRIDPLLARVGADPSASITLGKEVADDLYLVYSTELDSSERQLYHMEWQASRKFRLVAGRNIDGAIGGEFLYFDRFRSPFRAPAAAVDAGPDRAARDTDAPVVRAVAVAGVDAARERELLSAARIAVGKPTRRVHWHEARDRILALLVRRGYLSAEVDWRRQPSDPDVWDVVFRVVPGAVTELSVTGVPDREAKRLLAVAREAWGEAVRREEQILEAEDAMRASMQSRGYFTADVFGERRTDEEGERVVFEVDRGRKVVVKEVSIEGAMRIPEARVRKQLLTRKRNLFASKRLIPDTLDEDLRAIRNLYLDQGFLDVRVPAPRIRLSTDGETARVAIRIEEGARYPIRGMSIERGLPLSPAQALRATGLTLDRPYSPAAIVEGEAALRRRLDAMGYPDARVRARVVRRPEGVLVHFDVDPGEFVRLSDVRFEVRGATREAVVRRQVPFRPGDVLSRESIIETQHRLYRLGIFSNVELTHVPAPDGRGHILTVRTEDAKPIAITLGAGYDTEGDLRGSASVSHDNLLGGDRIIGLQTRWSGDERLLQGTINDPSGLGTGLPMLFNAGIERRDEVGYLQETRFAGLRLEAPWSKRTRTFLRYNFRRVDLPEIQDPLAVREEKLQNIQLADVAYTVFRDTRDDPFSPTRGQTLSAETSWFSEAWGSEASFAKLTGAYSGTWPLPKGQSYAAGVRGGVAVPFGGTNNVPLPERFFAGGDATLRGFERDGVGPRAEGFPTGGEALWLVNQEYRFPIWQALHGVVFYDAGNVFSELDDFDPFDLRHVLGSGLRLETPIGPLRLEYGRKLDRRAGEDAGEWFFSIGVPF